jgi:hypothetical protein
MPLLTYNGRLLAVNGRLTADPSCCCNPSCPAELALIEINLSEYTGTLPQSIDLAAYGGSLMDPDSILDFVISAIFESHCCSGQPYALRYVWYAFYTCTERSSGQAQSLYTALDEWVDDVFGTQYTMIGGSPDLPGLGNDAEVEAFMDLVRNKAASGGEDAVFETHYFERGFGCPC